MPTSTHDGISPSIFRSTIKQLVFGLLPGRKSSHLAEALAAGCGYASNAAYLSDVKHDESCTMLPVSRLSTAAMAERLSSLDSSNLVDQHIAISIALGTLSKTLPGNVVPVGIRSRLLANSVLASSSNQDESSAWETTKIDTDEAASTLILENLGLTGIEEWKRAISKKQGLCLVCGPTRSGTTTTLAASIRHLRLNAKVIFNTEHPVEYRIPYVGSSSGNGYADLDYGKALQNFMRAAPDVVLMGEINDSDTLRTAIQGSRNGHIVLVEVHSGSITSALARLLDLGASESELGETIVGVLVQTLAHVTCTTCGGTGKIAEGRQCETCNGRGYQGGTAISEVMAFDRPEQVHDAIHRSISDEHPWKEMLDDALDKMVEGTISAKEVRRIFGDDQPVARAKERGIEMTSKS